MYNSIGPDSLPLEAPESENIEGLFGVYWSSSETNVSQSYTYDFEYNGHINSHKSIEKMDRSIRSF